MVPAEFIVSGLVRRGVPETAAVALAGNAAVESRLDPGINEENPLVEGSRGGFGFMQWTGPRRRQLEAYAERQGLPVSDPDLQLDFLVHELATTEAGARDAIYSAADPIEAARLVSEKFLRPGIPHLERRLQATAQIAGGNYTPSSEPRPDLPNMDYAGGSQGAQSGPQGREWSPQWVSGPEGINNALYERQERNALALPQEPPRMRNALASDGFVAQPSPLQIYGFQPGQSPFLRG